MIPVAGSVNGAPAEGGEVESLAASHLATLRRHGGPRRRLGLRLRDERGHDRRGFAQGGCADGADRFVERRARKPLHEFRQ